MVEQRPEHESIGWWRGLVGRAGESVDSAASAAAKRLGELRGRSGVVDISLRVYERDREAAGTLLGSALALRLFLFFVPMALVGLGIAGLLGRHAEMTSVSSAVGIGGTLANEIDTAFDQSTTAPWLALLIGLFFMATTGRSLTRALVISSGLAGRLGGRHKSPVRVIGVVVGIAVGTALISVIVNRIRLAAGIAVASVSFGAVALVNVVLWSLLFMTLPRTTTDPGAALPGASLVAVTLTGLQAVSQLYLPAKIDGASSLYGAVGVTVAVLGWFFIIGRVIAFAFAVNAVLFEQIGSVSRVVFAVPGLRAIPRRFVGFARFFDLEPNSR